MTSPRRTKWKFRAVVAALLVVVTVVSCLFMGKLRKAFAGKVVAGYRYHCTLGTDWEQAPDSGVGSAVSTEEYLFIPSAPTPIREWIAIHLLHQPPTKRSIHGSLPELILATTTGGVMPNVKIEAGYPEVALPQGVAPIKHFRIEGCPATETVFDIQSRGLTLHYHVLLVSTPDYRNTYSVATMADRQKSDQAEHEIQAIVASFHVEKVAAPVDGKR